jgi:hypothetical protein
VRCGSQETPQIADNPGNPHPTRAGRNRPATGTEPCPASIPLPIPRALARAPAAGSPPGWRSAPPASRPPIIVPSTPANHPANLASVVTVGTPLVDYNWQGRWGAIADTHLFTIDLTGKTGTYNVGFLLTNGATLSSKGWTSLQLKVEQTPATAGACTAGAFDGTKNPKVMAFDAEDAGVYWNALPGNDIYCIGVHAADGHDTTGTFLRRNSDTVAPTVYPSFVTTVDKAS